MTNGMAQQDGLARSGPTGRNGPWISDRDAGTSQLLRDEYGALSCLRCLDVGLTADAGFQGAYPAETSALAALDDPRVAPPERYVVGATGRIIAVVRRHVDGTPLSALLDRRSRGFDWQTAAVVVTDVLSALSALHGRGVPHRSVHPSQVVVGADGVCVLVDVGLVRRPDSAGGPSPVPGGTASPREIAVAADLAAVAMLFAACVGPGGSGPGRPGTRGTTAADGVPDQLRAVLDRANDPDARDGRTAADLLIAFGKVTSRAFDAGWVERGRERLAELVADNRQPPPGLTEMVRAGWSRRRAPARPSRGGGRRPGQALRAVNARVAAQLPAALRRRRAVWQLGILLLLVVGFVAATTVGQHSRAVRSVPSTMAAGMPSHPSSIGTAYAAPTRSASAPSASTSTAPTPSASAPGAPTSTAPTPSASASAAPGGWQAVGGADHGTMSQDSGVSRSGAGSLRLTVPAGGYVYADLASRMAAEPGPHTYAAWIRTEGPAYQQVCMYLLFYDAAGRPVGSAHNALAFGGTHDWEYVSITLDTPSGATSADLQLRLDDRGLSRGGSAWFDDITVAGS